MRNCESSPFRAGDEVEAYYPQSLVRETKLYWPDTLANNQTVPMYCKKTLSGAEKEQMDFSSLGSILQIVFNTTQDDITLRFIDIRTSPSSSPHRTEANAFSKTASSTLPTTQSADSL